jgi:ribosomal protein S18 acetylase RimI-like enzyme
VRTVAERRAVVKCCSIIGCNVSIIRGAARRAGDFEVVRVHVRVFEESDTAAVAALWRGVFPDAPPWNDPLSDIERKLAVQRELFFVACESDRVVGTAMAGYDGHRGWVYYVAVSPHHRRRGIGAALMRSVEQALERRGCPKINLQVRATNRAAAAFYGRLGYAIEDRISMSKRLGAADEED